MRPTLHRTLRAAALVVTWGAAGCTPANHALLTIAPVPTSTTSTTNAASLETSSLPADFPTFTVTATNPKPGTICMVANAGDGKHPSYLFTTDQLGHTLYYKKLPDAGFDFERQTAPDGTLRYSYIQKEGTQLEGVAGAQGSVRLLDANYNEIKKLTLLPNGDHGELPADIHEFVYLGDNHYILDAVEGKRVSNIPGAVGTTAGVAAAIIQEVQDGKVVFEWDSSQHPEFYANASEGNDYTNANQPWADYMHMNSVCIDPSDNNLIVSFRHQDQVVKLDRKTGEILWRLGGKNTDFPLTDEQKFSHQHFARINADGVLTIFDNGNASQKTRMLSFKLDQVNHHVTDFDSLAPESRYSTAMGSFQTLTDGSAFIGWGAKVTGSSDATELGPDGTPDFTLSFTNPTYTSYRALKYLN